MLISCLKVLSSQLLIHLTGQIGKFPHRLYILPVIAYIAIGRNVRNHDYGAHGAAVISLVNGKELNRYHTKGPIQAISISDDGKYAAGIEVPAVTPDGDLIGSYDLHIWNRENDND